MKKSLFILVFATLTSNAIAKETILNCNNEHTYDINKPSKSGSTSGSFIVKFEEENGEFVSMNLDGFGLCGYANLENFDDLNIRFSCTNKEDDIDSLRSVIQYLEISRVTGKFENFFGFTDKTGGLIHTGTCVVASRQF